MKNLWRRILHFTMTKILRLTCHDLRVQRGAAIEHWKSYGYLIKMEVH